MEATCEKKSNRVSRWFRLCPVRHILVLFGGALIGGYFALRQFPGVMSTVCVRIIRPYHRFFSRMCSHLPFSAAEALIVSAVIAALCFLAYTAVQLIRRGDRGVRLYRFFMTCLSAFFLVYGGFCLLWGVYYDSADFEAQSGITGAPASTEQLQTVTEWFTGLVNYYADQVPRDDSGCFDASQAEIFDKAPLLYREAEAALPCLSGDALSPKPFFFSRLLSYLDFTGFFFPFTGEANINVDTPGALIPSTIAHELAHQRGVAEEDEANFVAVFASLENGDPVYCYSSALMAYIHLGNALYRADREAWAENYARLCEQARCDLAANNAYWNQFETPVAAVSDSVYSGFLQSYGQTLGLQTYGKCVDLLIAYYYEIALEAVS